jgi:proline dehydrogenase
MPSYPEIVFDNTEIAFAHRSARELREANWLFSTMTHPWLVKLGTTLTPMALKAGLPIKGLIRATIFEHFVGGETLEATARVAKKLAQSNVKAILDYGVEGKEGEENFDHAEKEFIRVINYASTQPNIPFMSVKVTGFARFDLLQKLDILMHQGNGSLIKRYDHAIETLEENERNEWKRVHDRLFNVCKTGAEKNVGVFVDAEESWIQDPVDALTMLLMDQFNKQKAVVYNTLQMYRHDRLKFLEDSYSASKTRGFILGAKLVRGAYMEKERKRAALMGYPSPIQVDKEATDRDFNLGVKFCIDHIEDISLAIASHNEHSNLYGTQLLKQKGLPLDHKHVHFSQLYGMSDNITYNLAKAGCSVSKYLPFGPIKDVIPYLMRRAQENTSVGGQTGRELALIKTEIKRRKKNL